jgi:hypothetical protein
MQQLLQDVTLAIALALMAYILKRMGIKMRTAQQ